MVEYLSGGGRRATLSASVRFEPGPALRLAAVIALGALAANCSTPPQKLSSGGRQVDPKYGVLPSRRLYGENDAIPKGGGRNFTGRSYVIAGRTYVPKEDPRGYSREGLASWYGTAFHGRETANGEVFDRFSVAAAHPTLPLPSYARVTNLSNGHSMIVRVNDRGPYHDNRIMDVSQRVAEALDFRRAGTTRVRVEYAGKASLKGSDDTKLMATLRTDGRSAPLPGQSVMFAAAGEEASPVKPTLVAMASRDAEAPEEPFRPAAAPTAGAEPSRAATPVRTALAFKPSAEPDEDEAPRSPRVRTAARGPMVASLGVARGTSAHAAPQRVAALAPSAPRTGDEPPSRHATAKAMGRDGARGHEAIRAAAKPAALPPLRLSPPPLQLARATPEPHGRPGPAAARGQAGMSKPTAVPAAPKMVATAAHAPRADARAPGAKAGGPKIDATRSAVTKSAASKAPGAKSLETKTAHAAPPQGAPKRAKLAEAR